MSKVRGSASRREVAFKPYRSKMSGRMVSTLDELARDLKLIVSCGEKLGRDLKHFDSSVRAAMSGLKR